jgi:hypothetical protein
LISYTQKIKLFYLPHRKVKKPTLSSNGAEMRAAVSFPDLTEPVVLTLLPKSERHPSGERFALRLKSLLRDPSGRSMTVWYLSGNFEGPPPTSMYSVRCGTCPSARLRASSSVSNLVGVEIAKDFGLVESLNVEVAAEKHS